MASINGTNFAIAAAPTPSTVLATEKWGGRVKALVDVKQMGATRAAGTLIYLGKLPKGALPLVGFVQYSGSVTATLTVGYTGGASNLGSATALATTPNQVLYPNGTQWNTPLAAAVDVYATIGAHSLAASDTLRFKLLYAKD